MKRKRLFTLMFLCGAVFAFYLKSMLYLDPDLGWSLKLGEIISSSGFPRTDPFSYTMPDFAMVAHSWLSDVVFYSMYAMAGIGGIALITSMALAATMMVMFGVSWQGWVYVPALLVAAHFFPYAGTRPQTFSWLFFAILLRVLLDKKASLQYGRYLPIFFLLWAQLHGGFFIGLILLAIWALFEFKKRILIVICATSATLINPYGVELWREIAMTVFSLSTRASVNEWAPTLARLDLRLGFVMLLPTFLLMRFPSAYPTFFKITYAALFLLMLSSSKFLPFWLVAAGYSMILGFSTLEKAAAQIKGATKRFNLLLYLIFLLVMINSIVLSAATIHSYKKLSEDAYYPKKAVAYLKNNPPQGNIFAPFGWGGYLVWQLPEKKIFISGLMPHWGNILDEYIKIISLESPFSKTAATYNISAVLVQKNKTNFADFARNLKQNGWETVYEDGVAEVLRRP